MAFIFHDGKQCFVTNSELSLLQKYEQRRDFLLSELIDQQEQQRLLSESVRQQQQPQQHKDLITENKHQQLQPQSVKQESPPEEDSDSSPVDVKVERVRQQQQPLLPQQQSQPVAPENQQPQIQPQLIIKKRKVVDIDDLPDMVEGDFFPQGEVLFDGWWSSCDNNNDNDDNNNDKHLLLNNFDLFSSDNNNNDWKQTLGLRLELPDRSKSWAFSLSPADENNNDNSLHESEVLFHFNPRYKKNQLVMNDKQGTWGTALTRQLGSSSKVEAVLSKNVTLMIQIRTEGFVVFANGMFCDFFAHRRDINEYSKKNLRLVMLAKDGNGRPLEIILQKAWWCCLDPASHPLTEHSQRELCEAFQTAMGIAIAVKNRTIEISGLPIVSDLVENYDIESQLFALFSDLQVEIINIVPGRGNAFVKMLTAEDAVQAIDMLDGSIIMGSDEEQFTLSMRRK